MEEKPSRLEIPRVRALIIFSVAVVSYALLTYFFGVGSDDKILQDIVIDGILFAVGMIIWLAFFAQFVLPVRTLSARLKVVQRLITYLTGGHGPAIFIENGFVRESAGESLKQGPGVMWLDRASAAVLRSMSQFKEAVGPGVHFTEFGEYLAGTHDMHSFTNSLGPDDSDEPFTVEKTSDNYQNIQKRRWETSGLTRDAVEVVAAISVLYRVRQANIEDGKFFHFDEKTSEQAIRDGIIRNVKHTKPVVNFIPGKMAVDVWREYLRKVRLNQLFEVVDWGSDTWLQFISTQVKNRLSQKEVILLDNYGRPTLKGVPSGAFDEVLFKKYGDYLKTKKSSDPDIMVEMVPSREFQTLTEMGLEVSSVSLKKLLFPPQVEERLVKQWTANWLKNAKKEQELVEIKRRIAETTGRDEAIKDFAKYAIYDMSRSAPTSRVEALSKLVHSTFTGVRSNASLLKRTNTEQRDLFEIYNRLR